MGEKQSLPPPPKAILESCFTICIPYSTWNSAVSTVTRTHTFCFRNCRLLWHSAAFRVSDLSGTAILYGGCLPHPALGSSPAHWLHGNEYANRSRLLLLLLLLSASVVHASRQAETKSRRRASHGFGGGRDLERWAGGGRSRRLEWVAVKGGSRRRGPDQSERGGKRPKTQLSVNITSSFCRARLAKGGATGGGGGERKRRQQHTHTPQPCSEKKKRKRAQPLLDHVQISNHNLFFSLATQRKEDWKGGKEEAAAAAACSNNNPRPLTLLPEYFLLLLLLLPPPSL